MRTLKSHTYEEGHSLLDAPKTCLYLLGRREPLVRFPAVVRLPTINGFQQAYEFEIQLHSDYLGIEGVEAPWSAVVGGQPITKPESNYENVASSTLVAAAGLLPSHRYRFRVRAINSQGGASPVSAISEIFTTGTCIAHAYFSRTR